MCGKQLTETWRKYEQTGSSPRVRGAAVVRTVDHPCIGIIPACAGSSLVSSRLLGASRDHPRVCGEQAALDKADEAWRLREEVRKLPAGVWSLGTRRRRNALEGRAADLERDVDVVLAAPSVVSSLACLGLGGEFAPRSSKLKGLVRLARSTRRPHGLAAARDEMTETFEAIAAVRRRQQAAETVAEIDARLALKGMRAPRSAPRPPRVKPDETGARRRLAGPHGTLGSRREGFRQDQPQSAGPGRWQRYRPQALTRPAPF